jgi:hypothetical protein
MKMKSENETKKQIRAEIFFFFLEKFETVTSNFFDTHKIIHK